MKRFILAFLIGIVAFAASPTFAMDKEEHDKRRHAGPPHENRISKD